MRTLNGIAPMLAEPFLRTSALLFEPARTAPGDEAEIVFA
jgi:hypothetical protein